MEVLDSDFEKIEAPDFFTRVPTYIFYLLILLGGIYWNSIGESKKIYHPFNWGDWSYVELPLVLTFGVCGILCFLLLSHGKSSFLKRFLLSFLIVISTTSLGFYLRQIFELTSYFSKSLSYSVRVDSSEGLIHFVFYVLVVEFYFKRANKQKQI